VANGFSAVVARDAFCHPVFSRLFISKLICHDCPDFIRVVGLLSRDFNDFDVPQFCYQNPYSLLLLHDACESEGYRFTPSLVWS